MSPKNRKKDLDLGLTLKSHGYHRHWLRHQRHCCTGSYTIDNGSTYTQMTSSCPKEGNTVLSFDRILNTILSLVNVLDTLLSLVRAASQWSHPVADSPGRQRGSPAERPGAHPSLPPHPRRGSQVLTRGFNNQFFC